METSINIVIFNAIVLAMNLFVFWKTFRNRGVNQKTVIFNRLCCTTTVLQLASLLVRLAKYHLVTMPIVLQYIVYIVMFTHMALPAWYAVYYLIMVYNDKIHLMKWQLLISLIPALVLIIMSILSPWTHWLFYIDANLDYQRGSCFILQMICPYLYLVVAAVLLIVSIVRNRKNSMGRGTTIRILVGHFTSFIVPTVIGVIIQVALGFDGGYSVIGISVGMVCLFLEQYMYEMKENQRLLAFVKENEKLEEINAIQKEQLQIVNALSSDYSTVFLIDKTDGSSRPFKQSGLVHSIIDYNDGEKHYYQPTVDAYIKKRFHPDDQETMLELSKLDVVIEQLKKKEEFTGNFRTVEVTGEIHYFQFKYRGIKDTKYIILGYQNIDALVEDERNRNLYLENMNNTLNQRMDIIQSLSSIYFASFFVSIADDTFVEISNVDFVRNAVGVRGDAQNSLYLVADKMVREDLRQGYKEFVNFKTLDERMGNKKIITYDYYGNTMGWCQLSIIEGTRDENGKLVHVLIAVRTIHDEKQREEKQKEELNNALIEAKEANAAKTSFLFNMSHDIRTPMNAIIGFTGLIRKYQEDSEKRNDYLKKIEDSSAILLSIINNVLEMARIEKGTIVLDENAWSTEQFNDTIFSVFSEMMKQKGIEFIRTIDVKHHYVYCDASKIREVFINILSNAYKYTNPGGRVLMQLKELPCDKEGYVIYQTTISDTGIGMDESFIPHIFEEFSREHNSTQIKIEGTGLGMAIVKKLVDFMGGTIDVSSKLGEGSTFVVTLSFRIANRDTLVNHEGVEIDPRLFENKRILLAEDNELNAEIAMEILKEAGFSVEHVRDGKECTDKLATSPLGYYDVILMDIQMPNMNGYEATRAIRTMNESSKANIPILAMTANAFAEDKKEALRVGMNGHVAKPINVHDLMKELARVLS